MEKKKVMIVEDDMVLAGALRLVLENQDYEILLATDGEVAEKMILQEKPDFVLLDLLLPIKSGLEVLKTIKQKLDMKTISVVVLTNFEQDASIKECMDLGAKDYIVKSSVDIKEVPGVIKRYMPV